MRRILDAAEVGADVWQVELDLSEGAWASALEVLSPAEVQRARDASRDGVRRHRASSRAALRRLLARYMGCAPGEVVLGTAPGGKPFAVGGPCFSWSTSGALALCAVSPRRQVGVDVERLREVPDAATLAAEWLSPEDRAAVAASAGEPQAAGRIFLTAWTRIEAAVKATGAGLRDVAEPWRVDEARWTVRSIDGDGWVGALGVER